MNASDRISAASELLKKINLGLWASELDEGSAPRMYVDDTILRIFGLEAHPSPEEMYEFWFSRIDAGYTAEAYSAIERMRAGENAEFTYLWHHPDGTSRMVQACAVRDLAYSNGNRVEGTLRDVTDVAQIENEKIKELNNVIAGMSDDFELLAHADFDSDHIDTYRKSDSLYEAIPEWDNTASFREKVRLFAERVVIPKDRAQFLHDADPAVISAQVKKGLPHIFYFRVRLGGCVQWFQAKCVHHKEHGESNCALIGIANNDRSMNDTMIERALIKALGEDFSYISYIDPAADKEVVQRFDKTLMDKVPGWYDADDYSKRMEAICSTIVHPDDREKYRKETSPDKIRHDLALNPVKYFNFRLGSGDEVEYFQGKYVLVTLNEVETIVIGYKSIDEEAKREAAFREELKDKADQLESYKRAILSDALISLEINLTRNEIYYGAWKDDEGNEVPLEDILGMSLPCSYEEYILAWNKRFVSSNSKSSFSGSTGRQNLIARFHDGLTEETFDYQAKTISGKDAWLRRSICMTQNQYGDVLAYTSVKDISC